MAAFFLGAFLGAFFGAFSLGGAFFLGAFFFTIWSPVVNRLISQSAETRPDDSGASKRGFKSG